MKVKVRWFKPSGTYYSDGTTNYDVIYFHQAVELFIANLKDGIRPGLIDSKENVFHALLKVYTEHGPLPFLVLAETETKK